MLNIIKYVRQKQNYLAHLVGTLKEEKTLVFNISYGGIVLTRGKKEFGACCFCSAVIIFCDIEDVQREGGRQSEKFTLGRRNEERESELSISISSEETEK